MILLDTHVLLWWQAGGRRLSAVANREIARADTLLLSPISLWEIAMLVRKGRIALDRDVHTWTHDLLDGAERVELTPLTAQAAVDAALLAPGFHGDPADRFLYATARELLVPLVSADRALRSYARSARDVRVVW